MTGGGCDNQGAVYVFSGGPAWQQEAYIKSQYSQSGDNFGGALAFDGELLAVGAIHEDACGTGTKRRSQQQRMHQQRSGLLFRRASDGTWAEVGYLKANTVQNSDKFGSELSISGARIAVGVGEEASCSPGVGGNENDNGCLNAGAVYVWE